MTRVSGVLCFLLITGALPGEQVFADEAEPSSTAYRVRVTAPGFANKPIVGTLIAINDKTITIQRSGANDIAVPAQTVTRFEVSRKAGGKRKGAAIGGLVGVAAGAALGFAAGEDCGDTEPGSLGVCISGGESALVLGVAGGLVGAVIGAIVASGEKWNTVDHKSVRISVSPLLGRHRRIGMLVTLRF